MRRLNAISVEKKCKSKEKFSAKAFEKNERFLIYFIISVGPILAVITFMQFKISPDEGQIFFENILFFDLMFIILIAVFLSHRAIGLIRDLKRNAAGSKLRSRLLLFTALIALTPTILIAFLQLSQLTLD